MSTGTPFSPAGPSLLTRRRLLGLGAALAGTAVGGSVLSACGGSPRPTAATSSASAPALVKPSGKVTLTLWTWAWPEAPADAELQKAFETAVPEVSLSVKKFPYPDYTTALRTGVPNGTAGDVLHLQTGSMIKQYAQYLVPLEDYAAEAYGADWRSQFLSGSVEEIEASKVGLVALPQQFSVGGVMFVNTALLKSIGGQVPNSYDEFLALSPKLSPKKAVAASWGAKDDWPNTDYLVQFASQYSPGIVAKAEAGEASFADDAIVEAMKFMQRTLKDNIWNAAPFATTAFPDAYNLFFNGKAASASLGTWGVGALYDGSRMDDWSAFLWPQLPDASPAAWLPTPNPDVPNDTSTSPVRPWRTVNLATAMRSGLDADKQWAAWQFIRWSCSKEGQQAGSKTYSPSRTDVKPEGLNERWNKLYDWQNSLSNFAERREFDYPETRTAIQTAISACCVNNSDPATELKRVDAAASVLAHAESGRMALATRTARTTRVRRRTGDARRLVSPGWLYVLPAIVLFGFFVAYPVVNTIALSFYDLDGISGYQTFIGLGNYREMVGGLDPYFWLGVRNTVLWTVVTVPVQLLLGLGLALVLDNAVRGRTAYRAAFFMPAVLSSAVISFAWGWIYSPQDGGATRFIQALGGTGQTWLADTSTAIWAAIGVSAWRYSGLIMLFYLAAMQMVPKELYEAAAIDGASWWRRVTNVTLPQLLPTTVLLILFGVIGALREFEVIYLLTRGGPAHATDLMSLQIFDEAFNQSRPGYGATISTALLLFTAVLAIPLLGLIGSAQRRRG